jgi:hypothetical protein
LAKAGLTKQQVEDVDARINAQEQIRFLNLAATVLHDEYLGFHLGQVGDLRRLRLLYLRRGFLGHFGRGLKTTGLVRLDHQRKLLREISSRQKYQDRD